MIYFTAHTFKCVCHCRRAMFRVLGMYNFGLTLVLSLDPRMLPRAFLFYFSLNLSKPKYVPASSYEHHCKDYINVLQNHKVPEILPFQQTEYFIKEASSMHG